MPIKDEVPEFAPLIHQAALDPHLPVESLHKICDASRHYNFSGFCTNLSRLSAARERLGKSNQTKLIAVIAFPFGFIPSHQKKAEAEWAAEQGAEELDVVPDFLALTEGATEQFSAELASICETGLPVRAILDMANLQKEQLSIAVEASIDAGIHGLQTGNGFGRSVVIEDVHELSGLARGRCEIKATGGIKTTTQAFQLIEAGATKLGTTVGTKLMQDLANLQL